MIMCIIFKTLADTLRWEVWNDGNDDGQSHLVCLRMTGEHFQLAESGTPDVLAWPSAMHRSWKPPNEPHLHLKGAPITPGAFYFIGVARDPPLAPRPLFHPGRDTRPFHQVALIQFYFRVNYFFSLRSFIPVSSRPTLFPAVYARSFLVFARGPDANPLTFICRSCGSREEHRVSNSRQGNMLQRKVGLF